MRDIVLCLVFGAYVWAAAVVGLVSLYVYARETASYAERSTTRTRVHVSNGRNRETSV
jgi:heme exporter protein D